MIEITVCPACDSNQITELLKCVDHSVSHETFSIKKCHQCQLLITTPRPNNSELGKYYDSNQYISHQKESTSILDIIYKAARVYTTNWKLKIVKTYSPNIHTLLDYGCGTGAFLRKTSLNNITSLGVEPSPKARLIATETSGCEITESIDQLNTMVDVVTLWHVLEHVPDPNTTLQKIHQLLNRNGTVFIAVPNHESYDAKYYQQYWAGYDVPRHLWHFTKKNLTLLLERNQFTLTDIKPMKLDALYVSILSEKHRQSTTFFAFVKGLYRGIKSNIISSNDNKSSLIYIAQRK